MISSIHTSTDKPKVSAIVVCYNEQENIERCLKSLLWADEIIVVDSFSTDRTVELCKKYTKRIYQREWPGFIQQKSYAVSLAQYEWVFSLDSDEVVTEKLRDEILTRLSADKDKINGYYVKRHSFYLGRWINHGGWFPDYKLRLFKKKAVICGGEDPHDKYFVTGKSAKLIGEIEHYTYKNISDQLSTIDRFSEISAEGLSRKGSRFVLVKMLFKPPVKFIETYVYKLGFIDGLAGFIIAILSSYYIFVKYAKLWEKRKFGNNTQFDGVSD
jgi:glycosyltransferase involved in cell wall biosynthesis